MSINTDKAKTLLQAMNQGFSEACKAVAGEQPLDPEAHSVYLTAGRLNVLTSQLLDKSNPRTVEGPIEINNLQAMITISDVEIRGSIEFEILHEGSWHRGHRDNSQFGQIFCSDTYTGILVSGTEGRVSLPLKEYEA